MKAVGRVWKTPESCGRLCKKSYGMGEIVRHAQLVIDTRNATRGIDCANTKVVRC